MGKMIDRIADAIAIFMGDEPPDDPFPCFERSAYLKFAISVISAMREPTETMTKAYDNLCDELCLGEALDADSAWNAMIDAALTDDRLTLPHDVVHRLNHADER